MRMLRTVATVLALCLLVAGGAVAGWWWSGSDRDELAGWIESTATAAAFLAAAVAAFYAVGAFRLESQREERWAEGQRTAQASMVAAWYEERVEEWRDDQRRERMMSYLLPSEGTYLVPSIAFRNASDVPVTKVRAELSVSWMDHDGAMIHVGFGEFNRDLIPPTTEHGYWDIDQVMLDERDRLLQDANEVDDDPVTQLSLWFTDAAGRRWCRDSGGALDLLYDPADPGGRIRYQLARSRRKARRA